MTHRRERGERRGKTSGRKRVAESDYRECYWCGDVGVRSTPVHRALGPGLLESAYEACLAFEIGERGLKVERQKPLPVIYHGVTLDCGYRLDLLVEERVIVEVKAVDGLMPIHQAQLLSYLSLPVAKWAC